MNGGATSDCVGEGEEWLGGANGVDNAGDINDDDNDVTGDEETKADDTDTGDEETKADDNDTADGFCMLFRIKLSTRFAWIVFGGVTVFAGVTTVFLDFVSSFNLGISVNFVCFNIFGLRADNEDWMFVIISSLKSFLAKYSDDLVCS